MNYNPYAPPSSTSQEDTVRILRPKKEIFTWNYVVIMMCIGIIYGLEIALGILIYLNNHGLIPNLIKFLTNNTR